MKSKEAPPITAGPHDVLDQVALVEEFPLRWERPTRIDEWRKLDRDVSAIPLWKLFG